MSPAAHAVHAAGLIIAFAVAGCGEVVRLGDGPIGTDATPLAGPGSGSEGGALCQHGQVRANEVLWIGDSWVQFPGTQHTGVRDLARAAGAIGPNDDYVVVATGAVMSAIANQYLTQRAGTTKFKVLIMDGGGLDLIQNGGSGAAVTSVVSTFKQLLATVASDGTVQQVIYYLVPELPSTPGVAALRSGMTQACSASVVPCHFLDLQPLWVGHPEYTYSDGIQASQTGGMAIANAVWAIMQQNCIAQ